MNDTTSNATPAQVYKNLAFSGGGVKGIAYGGVLQVLEDHEILQGVERVAGTSAGAIVATALAVGFKAEEVTDLLKNTSFKDFMDAPHSLIGKIWGLVFNYGWCKGHAFEKWIIDKVIYKKTKNRDLTFADLKKLSENEDGFRELSMIATNLHAQSSVIFSADKTPNVRIAEAVRTSMSIPFFFQSIRQGQDVYVDGGVAFNYPIELYDTIRRAPADEGGNTREPNPETLGFRLCPHDAIAYQEKMESVPRKVNNAIAFCESIIFFLMDQANMSHLSTKDEKRTVFIDTADIGTTDFDITPAQIELLIKNGKEAMEKYLKENPAGK